MKSTVMYEKINEKPRVGSDVPKDAQGSHVIENFLPLLAKNFIDA